MEEAARWRSCCRRPSGRTHGLHNSKRDPTSHDHQQEENEKAANNAEGTAIGPIAHGPPVLAVY